jgi:hypothetical protein
MEGGMNEKSRKFNDLLDVEVERRAEELPGDYDNAPYASHYLMEALAGWNDDPVTLDGKPVTPVWSHGGPNSDMPKWEIVVEYDGTLYYADEYFSSYDLAELGVFHEAESYVEPVTKYRRVK